MDRPTSVQNSPTLSPTLSEALVGLRPVRTRRPVRTFISVAAVSLGYAIALLACRFPPRLHLAGLLPLPTLLYVTACLATFLVLTGCALLPARGQVLSSGIAVGRRAAIGIGGLVALNVVVAMSLVPDIADIAIVAEPQSANAWDTLWASAPPCLMIGLTIVIVPVALSFRATRAVLPLGAWRVALGIGGAAGALAGLVLHLHCAVAGTAHAAMVHGAVLLVPAIVLAVIVWRARDVV